MSICVIYITLTKRGYVMSSRLKICCRLKPNCDFFCPDGSCSCPGFSCEDAVGYLSNDTFIMTRATMQNFRALNQEIMELKKLLSEIKQNQK